MKAVLLRPHLKLLRKVRFRGLFTRSLTWVAARSHDSLGVLSWCMVSSLHWGIVLPASYCSSVIASDSQFYAACPLPDVPRRADGWRGLNEIVLEMLGLKAECFAGTSQETCPVPQSCSNHPDRRPVPVRIVLLGSRCKMVSCGQRGGIGHVPWACPGDMLVRGHACARTRVSRVCPTCALCVSRVCTMCPMCPKVCPGAGACPGTSMPRALCVRTDSPLVVVRLG